MHNQERDRASLWDMLQAIQEIQDATIGLSYEDFEKGIVIQRAVERNFEILGEAANRISQPLQLNHPDIDWRRIIGMRNIIIHRYDEVDQETLWLVIQCNLPELKKQLLVLLEK